MMRKIVDAKKVLPISILPNEDGFQFYGVRADFTLAECRVELNKDGMHVIRGEETYFNLHGWIQKS